MTGFYMKCNSCLNGVNDFAVSLAMFLDKCMAVEKVI